jgi:hypothetical protein
MSLVVILSITILMIQVMKLRNIKKKSNNKIKMRYRYMNFETTIKRFLVNLQFIKLGFLFPVIKEEKVKSISVQYVIKKYADNLAFIKKELDNNIFFRIFIKINKIFKGYLLGIMNFIYIFCIFLLNITGSVCAKSEYLIIVGYELHINKSYLITFCILLVMVRIVFHCIKILFHDLIIVYVVIKKNSLIRKYKFFFNLGVFCYILCNLIYNICIQIFSFYILDRFVLQE